MWRTASSECSCVRRNEITFATGMFGIRAHENREEEEEEERKKEEIIRLGGRLFLIQSAAVALTPLLRSRFIFDSFFASILIITR